jgi:hypothetical protein
MGFFKDTFGIEGSSDFEETESEFKHSVLIYFHNGTEGMEDHYELGKVLSNFIGEQKLGVYDGHEIAMDDSHGTLFMYGHNAEDLFKGVLPILKKAEFLKGGSAVLRFGTYEEDAKEIVIELEDC